MSEDRRSAGTDLQGGLLALVVGLVAIALGWLVVDQTGDEVGGLLYFGGGAFVLVGLVRLFMALSGRLDQPPKDTE